jgi:hypothetical protein
MAVTAVSGGACAGVAQEASRNSAAVVEIRMVRPSTEPTKQIQGNDSSGLRRI